MSTRYFVETDGYDLHLWRQEGDNLPTIVSDPVEAWRKGIERGRREALVTPQWLCNLHGTRNTGDCPACDDELIALADEADQPTRHHTVADTLAAEDRVRAEDGHIGGRL